MSGERYSLGTCRYCGQVVNLERERDSQEAADIAASEECSCYDAREERAIQRKIENAQDRIQKVFGSEAEELGFRPINAPEPIQLMNDIAVLIARGYRFTTISACRNLSLRTPRRRRRSRPFITAR